MKVQDLIDRLSEYEPKAEVRLLHQPSYPMESTLGGIVSESKVVEHESLDLGDGPDVVFLLEGRQIGYGRATAWEVAEDL